MTFPLSRVRFDLQAVVASKPGPMEFMAACTQLFLDNLSDECGANCSEAPDTNVHIQLVTRSEDLALSWNTNETYALDVVYNSAGW